MAGSASRGAAAAQRASAQSAVLRGLRFRSSCRGLAWRNQREGPSCGASGSLPPEAQAARSQVPAWLQSRHWRLPLSLQFWRSPVTFSLLRGARLGAGDGCVEGSSGRPFRSSDPVALKAALAHSATPETKMRDLACKSSPRLLRRRYSGGSAQSFDRSPGGVSALIFYCHQGPGAAGCR